MTARQLTREEVSGTFGTTMSLLGSLLEASATTCGIGPFSGDAEARYFAQALRVARSRLQQRLAKSRPGSEFSHDSPDRDAWLKDLTRQERVAISVRNACVWAQRRSRRVTKHLPRS